MIKHQLLIQFAIQILFIVISIATSSLIYLYSDQLEVSAVVCIVTWQLLNLLSERFFSKQVNTSFALSTKDTFTIIFLGLLILSIASLVFSTLNNHDVPLKIIIKTAWNEILHPLLIIFSVLGTGLALYMGTKTLITKVLKK